MIDHDTIATMGTKSLPIAVGPFEVVRLVGVGGMGVVYEGHDRVRGRRVALKTLVATNPAALLLLKREFRAVADIAHPNLVGLYELVEQAGQLFLVMELVDGIDFLSYVRGVTPQRCVTTDGSAAEDEAGGPAAGFTDTTASSRSTAPTRPVGVEARSDATPLLELPPAR